jgi:hypothetical protein
VGIGKSKSNQYQEYDSETDDLDQMSFSELSADEFRLPSRQLTKGRLIGSSHDIKPLNKLLFG